MNLLPWLTTALLVTAAAPLFAQIYADFTVSQGGAALGQFRAELKPDVAPLAVANFMGLAEGSRTWIDPATNRARSDRFYDGLTFHRIVDGFVIQGGSPQGDGSDGPGYTFPDEFDGSARHATAGVLSMANSGLNSNGSQFFVTLAAQPQLDDVHTVFGHVVAGLDVVEAVGAVDVTGGSSPVVPVIIDSVAIVLSGAEAEAFDPSAQALPVVGPAEATIERQGDSLFLRYPRDADSQYVSTSTTDFIDWTALQRGPFMRAADVPSEAVVSLDGTFDPGTDPKGFFAVSRVAYPNPILTPPDAVGKSVNLSLEGGPTLVYTITEPEDGAGPLYGDSEIVGDSTGNITFYFWNQEAYRARFATVSTNIVTILVSLAFEDSVSGTFTGSANPNMPSQFPIDGSFTVTDAP